MGFENNSKSRKVICHQLTWIPKTQGLSLRMVNDYHSCLTPRPTPSVSWLQEAARHFVIKYTSWEMYSEYPSGVSGTLLDTPMKMTRWDSISLVKCQFGADFNWCLLHDFLVLAPDAGGCCKQTANYSDHILFTELWYSASSTIAFNLMLTSYLILY